MHASIVVPTYNRRSILEKCLESLANQSIDPELYEIIVVDDCSDDDTYDYMSARILDETNIVYIRHIENLGRVKTRNDGIRLASSEIIIFLDNDNVADYHFVASHLGYHKAYGTEHIAVVGNAQYAPEVVTGSNFARYLQNRYLGSRSRRERKNLDYANLPPNYLGGLNFSARKKDLVAVGLFDPSYRFYGGEDEQMGFRLRELGVRIIFGEHAKSLHYDEVSLSRYKLKLSEAASKGLSIITKKNPDYASITRVGWLLPISLVQDSFWKITGKLLIRTVLNPISIFLLERLAMLVDQMPRMYMPIIYRLLTAGWIMLNLNSKHKGPLVTYYDFPKHPT